MKYLITLSVLALNLINLQSQTYSFYRTSPEIIYTNDSFGVTSNAEVMNYTSDTIEISLIRTVVNIPPGWETCMCDIEQCHPPGMDTATADYPPGLSSIYVMLWAHSIPGMGFVTFRAEKVSSTNENYTVTFGGAYDPVGIHQISTVVKEFSLEQNYPNPFNPSTNIRFHIPKLSKAKLSIFDVLGNEAAVLVDGEIKHGVYEIDFDGSHFVSGIYFYRLVTSDYTQTRKMILIK